jgi:hypothetical protein
MDQPLQSALRNGVFSDDNVDHEFESMGVMAWRQRLADACVVFKHMKVLIKPEIPALMHSSLPAEFYAGNTSETLAFCAARSHIGAVR